MPGHEIAHYQILAKLGAGGMGVVYLAQDARLGRRVALKVLPTEFARDEDRVARFEREARAVAALSHPGIAVLYEIGEADAVRYLAMEYVEGRSLQEELAAGPLSVDRLIDYTTQIADALEHAHRRGILHRDIKPANIMVTPDRRVKLLDFGLGKVLQGKDETRSAVTAPGTWMGTLHYCAPEVLRGHEADRRSDLYSFGIVLYQMACGRLPFEGLDGHALVSAILSGQARPAKNSNPLIGASLDRFVMGLNRARVQEAARRHNLPDAGHSQLIELGKELDARWLVVGSYQRAGERIRILPRVIEVATGDEVATAKIDGSWEEIFALQDRVVADVMAALEVKVDSSAMDRIAPPETLHLEAYEEYAQGRQQFNANWKRISGACPPTPGARGRARFGVCVGLCRPGGDPCHALHSPHRSGRPRLRGPLFRACP